MQKIRVSYSGWFDVDAKDMDMLNLKRGEIIHQNNPHWVLKYLEETEKLSLDGEITNLEFEVLKEEIV